MMYRPTHPEYTLFFNDNNDPILNIPISTKHKTTNIRNFNYHFHLTQYPHSSFKYLNDSLDICIK